MNMHKSNNTVAIPTVDVSWSGILADRKAAKVASDFHYETISKPLYEEIERTSPRPDLCFEIEALDGKMTRYRIDPSNLHAWDDHWSPVIRRNAAAIRDAWLLHREACERLDMDAVDEESDRLVNEQCAIESVLIMTAAPDEAALLWKLEHLFGAEARDADDFSAAWCPDFMNALMSDAHRLLDRSSHPILAWPVETKIAA
jgi:hypothetical protein